MDYTFKNKALFEEALSHSSYANENNGKSYERLEFLGDSILSFIISEYLVDKYNLKEGELSKIRARIVCENALEMACTNAELVPLIRLSRGEELTGGRERASIIADVFEAVIAAVYLDGGIQPAKEFVFNNMTDIIPLAVSGKLNEDYKTALQEIVQADGRTAEYRVISESGPEHNKIFTVELCISGEKVSQGIGRNKKEAEQNAAKDYILLKG